MSLSTARHPFRLLPAVLLPAVLLAAPVTSQPPPPDEPAAEARRPALRDPGRSMWWHQRDLVAELDLDREERRRMDAVLGEHLDRRRELAKERMEQRRAVAAALEKRDWDAARRASDALTGVAERAARNEVDLKIGVLQGLDAEQLERLVTLRPRILERQWLPQGMRLRARSRPAAVEGEPWPPIPPPPIPPPDEPPAEGGG